MIFACENKYFLESYEEFEEINNSCIYNKGDIVAVNFDIETGKYNKSNQS
jgi:hypothetical protein